MKSYLINTETMEWPIYEGEYRLQFPNTSFPLDFTPDLPHEWVHESDQPAIDNSTQGVKEITPIKVGSTWVRNWEVYDLTQEELDRITQTIKFSNTKRASKLLQETDWTQLADVELVNKQDFSDYRKALRSIATNPPGVIATFPSKPTEVW